MKVFKFGGASVKDADSVRNVGEIIRNYPSEKLVIVFSAMAKTTNALEGLLQAWYYHPEEIHDKFQEIFLFHQNIIRELFPDPDHVVHQMVAPFFAGIMEIISAEPGFSYDSDYDALVPYGELLSTAVIGGYLHESGLPNQVFDAGELIKTNSQFREAGINWEITCRLISETADNFFNNSSGLFISQGFIGKNEEGHRTTLGREGSDFTAAIFAHCLDASEAVIWKDVDGLLNADPKYFKNTVKLNTISYQDAIELSYYGASVIHPKTIQPLENKKIPLKIKSFLNPAGSGSLITTHSDPDSVIPSYIFKPNQVLLSIKPNDFSFIAETHLRDLFSLFTEVGLKINLMQNSAISFSVCVDNQFDKLNLLLNLLKDNFYVRYNEHLELITVRYYTEPVIQELLAGKVVILEQKSRITAQFVTVVNPL